MLELRCLNQLKYCAYFPLRSFSLSCNARNIHKTPGMSESTSALLAGLKVGDRSCLARAITLVESTNKARAEQARLLVEHVTQFSREQAIAKNQPVLSFRIGLSGPPGAGKSTFIESLGKMLTKEGNKVAVLAVDPSSGTTGGSLLGDKTRMPELTVDPSAYIRPSPSRGHLGGVTRTTNEAILLCEAAGFNIIIVETVGVGQSEYLVSNMVDLLCLLLPPAGGDELQGIKRGIVEQSDIVVVTKYDGDLIPAARRIAMEYTSALKYMRPRTKHWRPKVKLCSARTNEGLQEVWETMTKYNDIMLEKGMILDRRAQQHRLWMWSYVEERLISLVRSNQGVASLARHLETAVIQGELPPGTAADTIINAFVNKIKQ